MVPFRGGNAPARLGVAIDRRPAEPDIWRMRTSGKIVVARKPRSNSSNRKPLPQKPAPACGPIVRQVRGQRVPKPVDPEAEVRGQEMLDRLMADPRRAARGE